MLVNELSRHREGSSTALYGPALYGQLWPARASCSVRRAQGDRSTAGSIAEAAAAAEESAG